MDETDRGWAGRFAPVGAPASSTRAAAKSRSRPTLVCTVAGRRCGLAGNRRPWRARRVRAIRLGRGSWSRVRGARSPAHPDPLDAPPSGRCRRTEAGLMHRPCGAVRRQRWSRSGRGRGRGQGAVRALAPGYRPDASGATLALIFCGLLSFGDAGLVRRRDRLERGFQAIGLGKTGALRGGGQGTEA